MKGELRPDIVIIDDYQECSHTTTKIRVLESVATCEKTVLVCTACGKQLSEPKTEC